MKARVVNNKMMKYEKPKLRLIDISKLHIASGICGGGNSNIEDCGFGGHVEEGCGGGGLPIASCGVGSNLS